jgi:transposase InsO family protein
MPHRYVRDLDGRWRCPPGERFAEPFGFFYRLRSSAEIDWVFQRNVRLREDYLGSEVPPRSKHIAEAILALVGHHPGMHLDELAGDLGETSADDVYALIASNRVYVDLHTAPLAEPGRVRLFRDPDIARACAVVGNGESILRGLGPEVLGQLARASPADLREANRRHTIVTPHLAGRAVIPGTASARTIRRWLARGHAAERIHGSGYIGLLPHWSQRGNRRRKLAKATLTIVDEFLADDYETLKQKRKFTVYAALVRACQERGVDVPTYKTFVKAANQRPRQERMAKRQGMRAAVQAAPFCWELSLTTPRHGDRPFELAHLDHTQLDVELVCSRTGRNRGRPWATFLSDAFTRRLLAVCLTFDPPSYRACMLALRECVRRHQRLPETVVVDGGPEFASIYFETLLARYACAKKTRPAGRPRFGSVCERLFGTTNTRFVHTLAGNTQIMRQGRIVTKAVGPRGQAHWTLGALSTRVCEWAYDVYDRLDHPALGQSPREAFATGLQLGGQRPQRFIAYDDDFCMLTLPTTRTGTAKLHPGRGVKIHYLYYWADAFVDPDAEGTQVPVRYDPFDAGLAYAFVKKRWVRCISEHHARFAGRSEREIQLASAELRRRQQLHGQRLPITARSLADFLASLEAEEVVLEQRLRDAEAKEVVEPLVVDPGIGNGVIAAFKAADTAEVVPDADTVPVGPSLTGAAAAGGEPLVIYEDY